MGYRRCDIVRSASPFSSSASWRPWLIINNDTHPFHGTEYIALLVTTTERPEALPIDDTEIEEGGLPRQSYVHPWNPITIKEEAIQTRQATVSQDLADRASRELNTYTA